MPINPNAAPRPTAHSPEQQRYIRELGAAGALGMHIAAPRPGECATTVEGHDLLTPPSVTGRPLVPAPAFALPTNRGAEKAALHGAEAAKLRQDQTDQVRVVTQPVNGMTKRALEKSTRGIAKLLRKMH